MHELRGVIDWFSGGSHQYMRLYHCMNMDTPWVVLTVTLDFLVALGYLLIARHWWINERALPESPAKQALRTMRNIFIFCGTCGYLFIPIKMVWPAWRLYDFVMAFLVYFTWKYAASANNLKVIYNELNESKKLKADLEQSQEESRRKSRFLNALSHDLRTPINALLLHTQVARMSITASDGEATADALLNIENQAKAASGLLESLLVCARLDWAAEPNQITTFPLRQVLSSVAESSSRTLSEKGVCFSMSGIDQIEVRSDFHKLERILQNLVGNAVKFTERGSVNIIAEAGSDTLELQVVDTGPGISAAEQEQVFGEFFQVDNGERDRSRGFGLGLSIARRLARQLNGDITLTSTPGQGSRFTLTLPGCLSTDGDIDHVAMASRPLR